MSDDSLPLLTGPPAIAVPVTLGIGGRAKPALVAIALTNAGDAPVTIRETSCDPVQRAPSGAAADARIAAVWRDAADASADRTLQPGETASLVITVEAPRRPGTYASVLRLKAAPGAGLDIPIALPVGVNPLWGIAAMLAGLMLMAVLDVLAGEAALRDQLHQVLQFRQDANERLERNPPPESEADNRAAFDADIRQAVQILTAPRQWVIADHRIEEARQRQRAAEDELKEIESSIAKSPAGAAQVAELDREWAALRRRMSEASARTMPGSTPEGFAGRVAALLANFEKSLLGLAAQIDEADLATQVGLVDLALSAGRRDDADRSAVEVRRLLQRDAGDIENRFRIAAGFEMLAGFLTAEEALARQRLADPVLDGATQQMLKNQLDAATAGLAANAPLSDFAETYKRVIEVGTQVLKARSAAVAARASAAVRKASAATSLDPVDKAMADNPPPPRGASAAVRASILRRILPAWDTLAAQADEPIRSDMKAQIAAIAALLDRGELKPVLPILRRLQEAWSDYGLNRINAAVRRATADYCRTVLADLRRDLARTEMTMQLMPDHADRTAWERAIDRLRVESTAIPIEGCMAGPVRRKEGSFAIEQGKASPLLDLAAQATALGQQVFTAGLAAVSISPRDRLEAAQASGVGGAETLARSLLDKPRPLTLAPTTPAAERYAGRPVSFRVDGLDPGWGAGVQVAVDYGDGSPVASMSAEEARKRFFVHTYATPTAPVLRVAAAFAFQSGTLQPADALLGRGRHSLTIEKSPLSAAQAARDAFLNSRFLLALLISGIVYFWQFWAKEQAFGAQSFDYVKAFALGAAVQVAVTNLPEALARISLG